MKNPNKEYRWKERCDNCDNVHFFHEEKCDGCKNIYPQPVSENMDCAEYLCPCNEAWYDELYRM